MARKLLGTEPFPVREAELGLGAGADPDVVYWLRPMTKAIAQGIVQEHTRYEPNRTTLQMEPVRDQNAVNDAILDRAIVRWEGITDGEGVAPCDLEHKKLLPATVLSALVERAGLGEVTPEQKAASFRQPA